MSAQKEIKSFIVSNFFVPDAEALADDASLLDLGIVDSTGVLEIIGFLESFYGITIEDNEMVPENLGSITNIAAYVSGKTP